MSDTRIRELLSELDRLIPQESAQVLLYRDDDDEGNGGEGPKDAVLPFCATRDGFLRFGLAFMCAAFAEGTGRGSNGGNNVEINLLPFYRRDSNVEFRCERVEAIPVHGDRRFRPTLVSEPMGMGCPIVGFLVVCLLVGLFQVCSFIRSRF